MGRISNERSRNSSWTFIERIEHTTCINSLAIKKLVDWKGGLAMAIAALIFSPIGAYTSKFVPEKPLMLLLLLQFVVAAARTLWASKSKRAGRSNCRLRKDQLLEPELVRSQDSLVDYLALAADLYRSNFNVDGIQN